ncbi:MAG TPA: methionyl-tRNA formyltransferase [Phycisphaerae bacterium]|nr:methionyl-tRNA formyltransferase [Phycisphaerae bacterium]HON66537.1 methionyl-tRNA formyltransferase [Phycisphaerae bacterium]HOQ84541.1 methionyl-tRNA formyltransferase [Phycisphaerae bacterium]HPZ98104.1 methionyl-tRNA formyltransferase [Phycisphaerae bacterium]
MRVVYFGSGDFAVPTLRWLVNSRHELPLVVTQPDRPAGRGKALQPTPVALQAAEEGVETLKCENVNTPEIVQRLADLRADIGVVAAFGQKLLEPLRSVFPLGCINLHASLLPKFRGAAPINAAILAGETKTGVTVFRLVDRMDAGPILLKRETAIGSSEVAGELHDRLAGICCDAIGAALDLLEREPGYAGEPQDESQVTIARKLKKSDGDLDFTRPAEYLARQTRAMWPWPAARCRYVPANGGKPVELAVITATAVPVDAAEAPGTITSVLTVATGQGTLEIHSVQPAGSRAMTWQAFVNGRHVRPGDRLEKIGQED